MNPPTTSTSAPLLARPRLGPWGAYWIYAAVIFALAACLSLTGLDNAYLWSDEAITALPARNFLKTGHFSGWDGRNLLAFRNGTLLDANLRSINPPLEILVTAAAFKLFGVTTWAARVLFVLIGLEALALFAFLLRDEFRDYPAATWYALPAFAFSHIFLLNIRQCRYYALALFFTLAAYMAWRRALARKRPMDFALLGLCAVGLFYSNCLLAAAFLAALACLHVVFYRRVLGWADVPAAGVGAALFLVAVVPYAVAVRVWHRPDFVINLPWYVNQSILVWRYMRDLNTMGCVPWALAGILILCVIARWKRDGLAKRVAAWAFLGAACVLCLAVLARQAADHTKVADVRYFIPAVPFLLGAVGAALGLIHRAVRWGWAPAALLLVLTLCTNVFCLTPISPDVGLLLPACVREVCHPYPTACQEAADYLLAHAARDEVVWAWREESNYPLIFYAGNKLKFACELYPDTPVREQARALGATLLGQRQPDWVVLFGLGAGSAEPVAAFGLPVAVPGMHGVPRYELAATLDVFWGETQRPELYLHSFGPWRRFNRKTEAVYVFRRLGDSRSP